MNPTGATVLVAFSHLTYLWNVLTLQQGINYSVLYIPGLENCANIESFPIELFINLPYLVHTIIYIRRFQHVISVQASSSDITKVQSQFMQFFFS
ncbi:hypothetical protein F4680DRAFT_203773 [Xylaria scruposa]|nr:hypothetical protein F4680DRAFT_203773 [Xylaria scruposa]